MLTQPMTARCENHLKARKHVCFGISPFNSYFSEARIAQLAQWGNEEFDGMHFFIPDIPSIYTLEAMGYDSAKAEWKARRQNQYLYNKTVKALTQIGIPSSQVQGMILNWSVLSSIPRFNVVCLEVQKLFEEDREFRESCIEATSWVLEGKLPSRSTITEVQARHAVKYLLSEIPVFLDTPAILEVETSVFCYHQCVPFIRKLMEGQFRRKPNIGQGFVVITPGENALPGLEESTFSQASL